MKKKLLILNGSRHGGRGQSGLIVQQIIKLTRSHFEVEILDLTRHKSKAIWKKKLNWANAFIFISGTYWDSWGAPLQHFFEEATAWEATPLWLGKPAAVIVSEHSTGGKHVLSSMQGVLNTLGLMIVPLGGLIISKNNTLLARALPVNKRHAVLADFWGPDDLAVVLHNLWQACQVHGAWKSWSCDRKDFATPWLLVQDF